MPFGQLIGVAATVVRTTAVVVGAVAREVVAVVAAVVTGAAVVVVVTTVVLVVVEVLVVVLLLVVELEVDVDEVVTGSSVATGDGDVGCSANGAVTMLRANRLPRTPSGTCPHMGNRRNLIQNRRSIVVTGLIRCRDVQLRELDALLP